jgi:hypothetical protein
MDTDNSHLFERLYTKAFKIFLAEVCLNEDQINELKLSTGDLIDKQTGKTFYELGKLIIEVNLDTNNNTIDLDKFKFAKHKFMKSIGFQRAIMAYYQQKNYVAVIKPSSPQSMMAKIILYYKPIKQPTMTDLFSDIDNNRLSINTLNIKKDIAELETNIDSDEERLLDLSDDDSD